MDVALAQTILFLRQHDDTAALRGLVSQRGQLRSICQFLHFHAIGGEECRGLAVAEGDRARLVEQQHIDIAGGLDGAP